MKFVEHSHVCMLASAPRRAPRGLNADGCLPTCPCRALPQDGAPLVAAVLFQEDDGRGGTLVTLRISYLLPRGWRGEKGRRVEGQDGAGGDRHVVGCTSRGTAGGR